MAKYQDFMKTVKLDIAAEVKAWEEERQAEAVNEFDFHLSQVGLCLPSLDLSNAKPSYLRQGQTGESLLYAKRNGLPFSPHTGRACIEACGLRVGFHNPWLLVDIIGLVISFDFLEPLDRFKISRQT